MNHPQLGRVSLFAALPPSEIERLTVTLRQVEFPPGAVVMREGERGDCFYLVLEGRLEIVKALGTPAEQLIRITEANDFVGEMSLLNQDGLRTASVRALTAARLLEMSRGDFEELLRRFPALAYDMARVLSTRLRATDEMLIRDLQDKNRQLATALDELKAAQAQIIEKQTLERELELAGRIQQSILPRVLPIETQYDFGACMLPARIVGGDFYDFIRLSQDTLGIVVGDVSGKGMPAAIFMALTRSLLRAEATRARSPVEAIQAINHHLLDMNAEGMFVTILYGVLNLLTREFVYVRAGHELPIIVSPHGDVSTPPLGAGHFLGIVPNPALDTLALTLPENSMLLLYTDGVTEAMDARRTMFGEERLYAVARSGATTAQDLCDHVLHAVTAHKGAAPQHDDLTLVAVHAR